MRNFINWSALIIIAVVLSGCQASRLEQHDADVSALTADHFSRTATVKNESLDTIITVSTEPGYQKKEGLFGITWSDSFVRVLQDKKTNNRIYQIYSYVNYRSNDWRFYETVNYETPTGPTSKQLRVIDRKSNCDQYGCTLSEHVAFEIDASTAQLIASKSANTTLESSSWAYRLNAKRGDNFDRRMLGVEMAGAMQRMDAASR